MIALYIFLVLISLIALSPHDSSDWCIDQFKQAFGNNYVDVNVGQKIEI